MLTGILVDHVFGVLVTVATGKRGLYVAFYYPSPSHSSFENKRLKINSACQDVHGFCHPWFQQLLGLRYVVLAK